jgi:sugar lactone lactonase YvrE
MKFNLLVKHALHFRPDIAMALRRIPICATLLLALAACVGGSGSAGHDGGTVPPTESLARGISVLAGATGGSGNADGPVGRLREPTALAIDRDGVLYVGDFGATIRRVAPGAGGEMVVGTRWKGAEAPRALVADASGNLLGIIGNRIVRIAPDGVQTTLAGGDDEGNVDGAGAQARFSAPSALAIDSAGLLYVADSNAIRTVTASGEARTHRAATDALFDVTGELFGQPIGVNQRPTGLAFDNAGNLVIAVAGAPVRKVTPAGARQSTLLAASTAVAADRDGNLYGFTQCTLYKADSAGHVSPLAGSPTRRGAVDGAGTEASFGNSFNCDGRIVTDGSGNVFVTDSANRTLRKVTASGIVTTVAGKAAMRALVDGAGTAARLNEGAIDLTFDGKDTLYVVQEGKVRKITRTGVVTTLNLPEKDASQNPITYFTGGMAYQGSLIGIANSVVYLVEENGSMRALAGSPTAPRQTDGSGAQAGFDEICGVTHDGGGNFYLLDCYAHRPAPDLLPDWLENRIRKVAPSGAVTTLYAVPHDDGTRQPWRIVADRQGNVFAWTNNNAVVRIAAAGGMSSIPMDLKYSVWLAVDDGGNLFLASAYMLPAIVEKISPTGQAQLIAGNRDQYGLITGALPGSLNLLSGMTVDDKGVIYVLTENAVVRIVQ